MVSLFSNLVVVAVMLLRPQKLRSTHVLIMALAASDIMFSLVISVISKLVIIFVLGNSDESNRRQSTQC